MSRIVDNLIAYKILSMLVTPFDKTDAFRLGIIDASGKVLKLSKDLKTEEEKTAYDYLHRLVFNLKRLLNKLPGGDNLTKNLVAAYFLVKESYETYNTIDIDERFYTLMETINDKDIILVEEEIIVKRFVEDEGMPVNNTTGIANPLLPLKKKKKVKPIDEEEIDETSDAYKKSYLDKADSYLFKAATSREPDGSIKKINPVKIAKRTKTIAKVVKNRIGQE